LPLLRWVIHRLRFIPFGCSPLLTYVTALLLFVTLLFALPVALRVRYTVVALRTTHQNCSIVQCYVVTVGPSCRTPGMPGFYALPVYLLPCLPRFTGRLYALPAIHHTHTLCFTHTAFGLLPHHCTCLSSWLPASQVCAMPYYIYHPTQFVGLYWCTAALPCYIRLDWCTSYLPDLDLLHLRLFC